MDKLLIFSGITIIYFIAGFYWLYANFKGAPFYPTNRKLIDNLLDSLDDLKNKKVVELGAGDGRVARAFAERGAKVSAIEINPILTLYMRFRNLFSQDNKINIINKDLFKYNFKDYEIIFIYLFPKTMKRLEEKINQECATGTIIISNTFKMKNLNLKNIIDDKIYIYEKK